MQFSFITRLPALVLATAPVRCATQDEVTPYGTVQEVPIAALNPDVRPQTIHQTICVAGYTASVRPAASLTNGVKAKVMREAGPPHADAGLCELDHRGALAIGGHPRALINLELEKWEAEDGASARCLEATTSPARLHQPAALER